MAKQILSTKVAVDFLHHDIQQIPHDSQFGIGSAVKENRVVWTEVFRIDTTQVFPQTPPEWVMESNHLALLVGDGSVTVA